MQFSVETVREVAQLLTESNLGEVTLETTGEGTKTRLSLKRTVSYVASGAFEDVLSLEEGAAVESPAASEESTGPETITVVAGAVGVFRPANPAVEVGAPIKKRQLLAVVEALKIPNEVYAPQDGILAEILASDGQGVEWGQPLFVLNPVEA